MVVRMFFSARFAYPGDYHFEVVSDEESAAIAELADSEQASSSLTLTLAGETLELKLTMGEPEAQDPIVLEQVVESEQGEGPPNLVIAVGTAFAFVIPICFVTISEQFQIAN